MGHSGNTVGTTPLFFTGMQTTPSYDENFVEVCFPLIRSAKWLSDPRCATSILLVVSVKSQKGDDFGNWDSSRVSRYTNALFLQLIGIPSFDVIQSTGLQSCARGVRL